MSLEKIKKNQKNLLDNCKKFLLQERKKNIDISVSPLCFFTVWANTPGYYKTLDLYGLKGKSKILFFFKNLLSISRNFDLKLFLNEQKINTKPINLILTYSSKKNFDTNGNFFDHNFNLDSKNSRYFWFLISLDNYIPKKIKPNIAIIAKKKKKSFSLIYLFKHLFELFFYSNFNSFKHYCWKEFDFSKILLKKVQYLIHTINIKNLILNYEGIPFQNYLINEIKRLNYKINTLGYLHCAPWPIQLDLIYKKQSLDRLIVSGYQQKYVLKKYLGWSKKKVNIIPSLRFKKEKKKEFNGFIFVPFNLEKKNDYLERLEKYLIKTKVKNFGNFKVRIHPLNIKSKNHNNFKRECESLITRYSKKKRYKIPNYSLFFGSATGVCVQALEEGTSIIHFPHEENLDVFSPTIWSTINTKKIGEKTYVYKLKKKNYTFLVNNEKNKFHKYFEPFLK